MSTLPCSSATNIISSGAARKHRKEHTRVMPEVDDKPQDNHCERGKIEPVWFKVLDEMVSEKFSSIDRSETYEEEKSCDERSGQAHYQQKFFDVMCIPKSRPKKSLDSKLKLKYAEEASR